MSEFQAADERMKSLEARILSLESTTAPTTNDEAVTAALVEYQKQVLAKLQSIRSALVAEGGDIATLRAQRDAAVAESEKLKKENTRLEYRVRHLIKALNEEEQRAK